MGKPRIRLRDCGIGWVLFFILLGFGGGLYTADWYLGVPLPNAKRWVELGCDYHVPGGK